MKNIIELLDNTERKTDLMTKLKGVTLQSLSVENILAPDLSFLGDKSSIQIPVNIMLDYEGMYQASINLIFTSHERINSLDKELALEVIKSGNFYCHYECSDDWEFDGNLGVQVLTKNDDIATWLKGEDFDIDVHFDEEKSEHEVFLVYSVAGEITSYFSEYMRGFRYGNTSGKEALTTAERSVLGEAVIAALVNNACAKLEAVVESIEAV